MMLWIFQKYRYIDVDIDVSPNTNLVPTYLPTTCVHDKKAENILKLKGRREECLLYFRREIGAGVSRQPSLGG